MATELEFAIEIDRPPAEVFETVVDPHNDHRWCPRTGACEQVVGEGPEVGARFELEHDPSLQRPHTRRIEIVELEPPTKVVTVQEDQIASFRITYLLEHSPRGTRLTQRDEIDWRINPLARPIGRTIVKRHMGEQLRSLKELMEGNGAHARAGARAA